MDSLDRSGSATSLFFLMKARGDMSTAPYLSPAVFDHHAVLALVVTSTRRLIDSDCSPAASR
jgi:hypothetical protein